MKVLLVLHDCFPTRQALWREISSRDIDLHVVYTLDTPRGDTLAAPDFGTAHELRAVRIRGDRPTWMAYRGLNPLVAALQPDLVHVLHEPWSVVASQAVHSTARAVVTHGCENLWDQGGSLEASMRLNITQHNLCRTSGFISWNSEGVAWARRRGLPADRPTLVVSSELPDLGQFGDLESKRETGRGAWGYDEEVVFGYVGRLIAEKGIDWLLRSWTAANLPNQARLVFVGQGPMESAIRTAAASDSRIQLIGPVPMLQVPTVMASLDVLVLPSLTTRDWCEQFGRVIAEAMTSGVPVIASDSGAIPEVVGGAGIIVKEGSIGDLSSMLIQMCRDPGTRVEFSKAGLNRARLCFSPAPQAERVFDFWQIVTELSYQR